MSHKTLKLSLFSLLSVTILVSQLSASITVNVTAEKLKDPGGFDMATSGVVALVADIGDAGFSGPTDTALEGSDFLVDAWDIASDGGNAPGAFLGSTGNINFSGDWAPGDDLALYFFPTLALTDPPASAAAVPFGMFRVTEADLDGTDPWVTPADGTLAIDLIVITTDATTLGTGSTPADAGLADGVTTGAAPADPSGVAGAANGSAIDVTWTDNVTDEDGYRIERSVSGSDVWMILGSVAAGVMTYSDDTVEGSATYLYRVIATRGPSQSAYYTSAEVQAAAASAKFTNLSTRALVQTGDNILIASFRVVGGPLRIYSRVAGPGLAGAGIVGFLADPTMELRRISDNSLVAENDNWRTGGQVTAITNTFIPPGDDNESALIANLTEEGFYSIVVRGVNDTEGFANVEVYDFADPAEPVSGILTNLSTRALVQTGDNILIASFEVKGDAPQRIYSRVAGPGLAGAGIVGFIEDPIMELRKVPENTLLGDNDSWRSDQEALILSTYINPGSDVEPALVRTLGQNSLYSVIVRGVNDTEGFANVEVYDFPE